MAKISTLSDDFQDGVIDTSKWTTSGTVVETGGRMVVTPTTTTSQFISLSSYDLTSSQVTAHIPTVTPVGISGNLQCGFAVYLDASNIAGFQKIGTELRIGKTIAGVYSIVAVATYSAVNHLYWRIRHTPNNIYFETSATGSGGFTIQHTENIATVFPVTAVRAHFFANYSGFESAPGTFAIESVNLGAQLTAAGVSTSSGSAQLITTYKLSGSATSASTGNAAMTIPPLTAHAITGAAVSTSTGNASFILVAGNQVTAAAQSYSTGSAAFDTISYFTATAQSFSTGTAEIIAYRPPVVITQYFYFEPPVVYDLPPTLPHPRPRYLNAHARWKGGQRRGRSVLRTGSSVTVLDTPTVDQTLAADAVYMGGHIYTITNFEADILSAAGLTVTPIPIVYTLYPAENVFPDGNLAPGFQEFILP